MKTNSSFKINQNHMTKENEPVNWVKLNKIDSTDFIATDFFFRKRQLLLMHVYDSLYLLLLKSNS